MYLIMYITYIVYLVDVERAETMKLTNLPRKRKLLYNHVTMKYVTITWDIGHYKVHQIILWHLLISELRDCK